MLIKFVSVAIMTLPKFVDEILPKLVGKSLSQILQIVASIVTVSAQHCVQCWN